MSGAVKTSSPDRNRRSSGYEARREAVQPRVSLEFKAFLAVMGVLLSTVLLFELVSHL